MGLADLVYPGALHTRFHHALGAMHLMQRTLANLSDKGHIISHQEYEAALMAIMLHDVGHGPFSHTLEGQLLQNHHHEFLTGLILDRLNVRFSGKLDLSISMFTNTYHRPFFHQLIASQLDLDRLDYLRRDSFFSGVTEGTVGADRIIKLFDIADDQLVVEEKGIYSIEHFLNARRIMYWQVYLHKTGIATDLMLNFIISRGRLLIQQGMLEKISRPLHRFLSSSYTVAELTDSPALLDDFLSLDDSDILYVMKSWQKSEDHILRFLCRSLLERKLFKIQMYDHVPEKEFDQHRKLLMSKPEISETDLPYLLHQGTVSNEAYVARDDKILIQRKNKTIVPIEEIADLPNIKAMSKIVVKHYLCWSNPISL